MIEFDGVTKEGILSDPTEYIAALSAEGCIAFRQIGLTRDEFTEVTQALGMDDSPVAQDIDHGTRFRQAVENPAILSGGLFLAWHMEDTYKEHLPQIIAINMHTFEVPHEPTEWPGGQTGFVDMHQCHNMMPAEWKESLKDARMLVEQVSFLNRFSSTPTRCSWKTRCLARWLYTLRGMPTLPNPRTGWTLKPVLTCLRPTSLL